MATVYSSWITDAGARFRVFLTYTETDSNTAHSVSYSCGIQGYLTSSGPSTGLRVGVKAQATGASDTAWHYINISNSTLHTYRAYSSSSPLSWDKTKTTQTKTLGIVSTAPISRLTQTITVPALQHWSVTYNANSGSGAPATQTKWYNEPLTLSFVKPTKSGYTFKGWATSQGNAADTSSRDAPVISSHTPGSTYSTNNSLNLWAVWELNYNKPTISDFDVKRCKETGELDDEGKYAIATFNWSVFRSPLARYYGGVATPYENNSADTFTVTIGTDETYTDSLSGTSGSETTGVIGTDIEDGAFDMSTTYPATVSLTDTQTTQTAHTGTASDTLPSTHFPLDFNANATAMGIFCPASDDIPGVHVGSMLYGNVPFARFTGKTEDKTYTTGIGEYYKGFNVFSGTGYSYSHLINDPNTFATDNNGVKILRDGYYLLNCMTHFNTQNTEQAVSVKLFNYTKNSQIGVACFIWSHPQWAHAFNSAITAVNEGDIVLPTFAHYQGSGWMKPSMVEFTVIYLGDLVI